MNKLLMFAKSIQDFRMERKKPHPVEDIVFITVLAVICNAADWEEIEDFGKFRKEYLSMYLDLKNGIPVYNIQSFFFAVQSQKVSKSFY
jgi:hypothetical protein